MKHWLCQRAKLNPYTHEVISKATKDDGSPKTCTMPREQAMHMIRKLQANGPQKDGCVETFLVLDKEYEVPDDKRGHRPQKFKPLVEAPPEPEVYRDQQTVPVIAAPRQTVNVARSAGK